LSRAEGWDLDQLLRPFEGGSERDKDSEASFDADKDLSKKIQHKKKQTYSFGG